jgi:hypothetical protein
MPARATDGTGLAKLVRMAIPLCRTAQSQCPRTGPGRPPDYDDWKMAILIMVAILKNRKSKSAQYRFLHERRHKLRRWLGLKRFPSRGTYFARYARIHRLLQIAVKLQGLQAIREGVATARTVAVDKSLVAARGPQWHAKDRKANRIPAGLHGVDRGSTWSFSKHHGWVQGYSYEVVVTANKGTVLPLLASADTASVSEHVSFGPKIAQLPDATRHVLADSGYDNNDYGDAVERDDQGHSTGRRFLCTPNPRSGRLAPPADRGLRFAERQARQRRRQRLAFYRSDAGRRLYRRRSQSVEPFNEWFKSAFGLDQTVWHRGLGNNQTQFLAAMFCYQLLLRYNRRTGHNNGQVQWILDTL